MMVILLQKGTILIAELECVIAEVAIFFKNWQGFWHLIIEFLSDDVHILQLEVKPVVDSSTIHAWLAVYVFPKISCEEQEVCKHAGSFQELRNFPSLQEKPAYADCIYL